MDASPGTACPKLVATPASTAPVTAMVSRATGGTALPLGCPGAVGDAARATPGEDRVLFMVSMLACPSARHITREGHGHPPQE
ncbi:hypothetical protein [Curtobacterium sp. MCJR17_043]|uniref:hypothetical protein n=1 Tax=Curtobacterium sp. MCJR17_043 TaxID=2175660 RepID=UPI0024DF9A14|nr:hypothetical protein [Curtobacterium sp. MCJR17_043]WIB36572.1 hypothetical protein DEJ15_05500 [Curtobacterium sp. MCJR17_043]